MLKGQETAHAIFVSFILKQYNSYDNYGHYLFLLLYLCALYVNVVDFVFSLFRPYSLPKLLIII